MADSVLSVQKLTTVPSLPTTANTVFLVAPTNKPDFMELYVSNRDGTKLKRHINEADVQALITASMTAGSKYTIVDDINARNSLTDKTTSVYVKNATGDSTVKSGGAFYIWDATGNSWIKISEAESMDINLDWNNISGRPTVTPTQINDAVGKAHTHTNATQLNKIGEEGGVMTYGGKLVGGTINDTW